MTNNLITTDHGDYQFNRDGNSYSYSLTVVGGGVPVGRVAKEDRAVPGPGIKWNTVTEWVGYDKYGARLGAWSTRKAAALAVLADQKLLVAAERPGKVEADVDVDLGRQSRDDDLADVVTLTPTTYTATCGLIAEQLVFKGHRYSVGYIAEGDTGRKVFGGEMVPGPWAFASLAPTVISAYRDPSPQPSVEVAEGDLVAIAGTVYRVRDRSTGPEQYTCGRHHLALDTAVLLRPRNAGIAVYQGEDRSWTV